MKKIYPKKSKGHWKDHKSAGHEGGKKFGAHGGWQGGTQRHGRGTIHQALCSSCAAPCEVPFKPNGKKPIFCHTCFRKNSGHTSTPRESTHDFDRQQTFGKPTRSQTSNGGNDDMAQQLKALHAKLDQILRLLMD